MECVKCVRFGLGRGERIGFVLYQSCRNREVRDMCQCLGCCSVGGGGGRLMLAWSRVYEDGVVLCLCVL